MKSQSKKLSLTLARLTRRAQLTQRTQPAQLILVVCLLWMLALGGGSAARAADDQPATPVSPLASAGPLVPAAITVTPLINMSPGSFPSSLVYGPQGAYWLTLMGANALASFTPPATVITDSLSTEAARPFDITIGPDAAVWFSEQDGNRIGRIDPLSRAIAEYELPTASGAPSQIVLGQDGGLWFTQFEHNHIGRIDRDGQIEEFALTTPDSRPLGIAVDLDGNLWFTEWNGYRIGRLTPQGDLSGYDISSPPSRPTEIVLGPDGNLWFSYEIGRKLVRLDPANGVMTSFTLATASNSLTDLAIGSDGRLWFLGIQTIGAVEITPAGPQNLEEVAIAPVFEGQGRSQLIAAPDGNMTFTTMNSQTVWQASASPDRRDLQVFIDPMYGSLFAGGVVTVTAQVVNWSVNPAGNVVAALSVDAPVVVSQASGTAGAVCAPTAGGAECSFASLPAGASSDLTFVLDVGQLAAEELDGQLALLATADQADVSPANNRQIRFFKLLRAFNYFNDFESGADAPWSHSDTAESAPGQTYLGRFDNDLVTLTFSGLAPHDQTLLCFDLYVMGAWDGDRVSDPLSDDSPPPVIGPDLWSLYLNLQRLMVTSFSNRSGFEQGFPADYGQGHNPYQAEARTLGEFDGDPATQDARYHICQLRPHTGESYKLTFYGLNLDGVGETWALDNVQVKIFYHNAFAWNYLPLAWRYGQEEQ